MTALAETPHVCDAVARAHFQLYRQTDGLRRGAPVPPEQSGVRWRLMAGNHRELGRSPAEYDGNEVTEVLHRWIQRAEEALARLMIDHETGRWHWTLHLEDDVVAQSARGYLRRVECDLSVRQFLALAPVADLRPTVHVFQRH